MNGKIKEKKEMKIKLRTVIISLVIILLLITVYLINNENIAYIIANIKGNQAIPKPNEESIASDFSVQFLQLENEGKNMVYSPLSIKYALNMLSDGTNGNTKKQIEDVIGRQSLTKYNNIDEVLSLANGVYIRDTYYKYVKEEYKNVLATKYNAQINYDSFNNANNINNWIEKKTLGIIKNMLRDESVQDPDNKVLLINALAIDMEWKTPFVSNNTSGVNFYLEDGSSMKVTTMQLETSSDSVAYYKDNDITAVMMDLKEYKDTQLEYIAIMPKENLSEYVETFAVDEVNNIIKESTLASQTKNGVDISIPRFSFSYDLKLKSGLKKLGIIDAFDENLADFSNISDTQLYVSDALHKANIDFTEKGIKAAAVTVIYMTCGVALEDERPIEININKPFLYVIRDKKTGEIWFIGTVYEPNSWENDKVNYEYR